MKFVQKWSFVCANHLSTAMNENHNRRSIYYYGFYIVIGTLVKGIILISTAAILGVITPTLVIMFVFGSMRMLAGGFHMDTYGKCLFVSMLLFILGALTAKYTYLYWNSLQIILLIIITIMLGLYVLIRYAPKDTPNKPITDPSQIRKFKKLSITYFIFLIILSCLFFYLKLNMFALALIFGILLEVFTLTPTGYSFFNLMKEGLNFRNKRAL